MAYFPSSWEFASLACKLFLYFGAAAIAGGIFSIWQYSDGQRRSAQHFLSYILIGSFVGFQAVLGNFLVQVGTISGSGFMGMFDWSMATILLDTPLGDVSVVRLSGFTIAFLSSLFFLYQINVMTRPPTMMLYRRMLSIYLISLLLLSYSFRIAGHISVLPKLAQLTIGFHFLAFAWWIGCLYPLSIMTKRMEIANLQLLLAKFGRHALYVLAVLMTAGIFLIFQLIDTPRSLISTSYGLALSIKLVLVLGIFSIAAWNKLRIVPALVDEPGRRRFLLSIRIEMLVALSLLSVTAYLSTVVGPDM